MFVYWLLFFITTFFALTRLRPAQNGHVAWTGAWSFVFVLLVVLIGLRFEVGGDWLTYIDALDRATNVSLNLALSESDPAYGLINWIAGSIGFNIYFVNTVCALVFSYGLVVFCRNQPRPWLALVVSIPYLVTVVAMGYTRQGAAIGLVMLALVALTNKRTLKFALFIVLAASFHKSAVILLPLAVLAGTKRKVWTALWIAVASVMFYKLMLQDSVETLRYGYLEQEYQSQGAGIRIAMNAVPAALFLFLRAKFALSPEQKGFWTWMSVGALGFVVLLVVSPSSTAVDRLALYWIPLQLFVLSRLPDALGKYGALNAQWVKLVVLYSALVEFVWLFFAQTAFAWLPYQNALWSWL